MQRRRHAFTLVELLVAMALIMFIMAILSQAFVTATNTFRDLKSAADMAEKLRSTTQVMRRYLAADHFEGKRRLSDPNFWQNGPPREGFFRVWHGAPSTRENPDPDGIASLRSTTHALHFTVKLRGSQRNDYFSATPVSQSGTISPLPGLPASAGPVASQFLWQAQGETRYEDFSLPSSDGTIYNWQWAEVEFFLQPTNDNANGVPLYGLYLRHHLAVTDTGSGTVLQVPAAPLPPVPGYLEVSNQPDPSTNNPQFLYFNSPVDLTMPVRRFNMTSGNLAGFPAGWTAANPYPYPTFQMSGAAGQQYGAADLLLANVISFDVRLLTTQPPTPNLSGTGPYSWAHWDAFEDLFQLTSTQRLVGTPSQNLYYPVNNPAFSTSGPLVFDTWSNNRDSTFDYTAWATPATPASIPILNNSDPTTPQPIIIRAVQVTLRIWDEKTQMARQATFVQEL